MIDKIATPLRYPGGKSVMTTFFSRFIAQNNLQGGVYVEPYCGGAGAALNLLLNGDVTKIVLNDADYSIYSFWISLTHYGKDFLELLDGTEVSLPEWYKQHAIWKSQTNKTNNPEDILANGFATFYLNRCNRSGIIYAGPIGGKKVESQLAANYKIDARFNKKILREKIEVIISRRTDIVVNNMDALSFIEHTINDMSTEEQERTFVYLDPPYYIQGSSLYMNHYNHDDHAKIANFLSKNSIWKWVLSYDNVSSIQDLYRDFAQYSFYINYSVQSAKMGSELVIHSKNSVLPTNLVIKKIKSSDKRMVLAPIEKLDQGV